MKSAYQFESPAILNQNLVWINNMRIRYPIKVGNPQLNYFLNTVWVIYQFIILKNT